MGEVDTSVQGAGASGDAECQRSVHHSWHARDLNQRPSCLGPWILSKLNGAWSGAETGRRVIAHQARGWIAPAADPAPRAPADVVKAPPHCPQTAIPVHKYLAAIPFTGRPWSGAHGPPAEPAID